MSRLRDELETQYKQSKKSALSKMVELKDSTFKECEEKWNKEKTILMNQVSRQTGSATPITIPSGGVAGDRNIYMYNL